MPDTEQPNRVGRRRMHRRSIECIGYLRDDGLWEVEARLVDTKPFQITDHFRAVSAGDAIHDIGLRLAVDESLTIREAEAMMNETPYPTCVDVQPILQRLVGERIGKGWREAVRKKIGRLETCTHLAELLGPAVTTLFQTLTPTTNNYAGNSLNAQDGVAEPPFFINGCHSWRTDGPVVAKLFPQYATKPPARD